LRRGAVPGNSRVAMSSLDLREALGRYEPSDAREAGFLERMVELARSPSRFRRDSFAPGHFTASAFVLSPERDALLLIFHKKLSLWLQPGGHVEETDASVLAAARREVLEEVGIAELSVARADAPLFDVDVHVIPERPGEPRHEHFDLRFLFVPASREFAAGDEVGAARWVPLAELAAVTTDESVQRAARKIPFVLGR
jgi:8-oxo-dGTP pyrophosphatase MutT (NUDIX family)